MKQVILAASLFLLAPAVHGSDASLEQSISLNLRQAGGREVLASFGGVLSVVVEVDPAISGKISIQLDGVTVRTTLQAVCESLGCTWRLDDGVLRFAATPQQQAAAATFFAPLDLALENAEAGDFFQSLAQILAADLALDPTISGTFSLDLDDADLDEILSGVCAELDCVARVAPGGERPILEVRPRASD